MREPDRQTLGDRRKKSTPCLSRYTFSGRRRAFRRKEDQERGGYVDRYSSKLFFFLILVVGLNLLDAFFTMIILDHGGSELNPIVASVISLYGDEFWIWKFVLVSASLILLCLHSKFRRVKVWIFGITIAYLGAVLYQFALIVHL